MGKYRVDACKVSRSIRLVVTLVVLLVFIVLVYYSFDTARVPVAYASPGVASFYPSGYNLLGSTKYLSGSLTDLQSDNAVYMSFRSYVSSSSTTAKTNAFIAYRDNTNGVNTPKERTWTGDTATWGPQSEMPTSGSYVQFTRVAYCPKSERSLEKIVVTQSYDGYLDAFVWDGTSWTTTNNIGFIGTTTYNYRLFDIAYEKTSGEAILVYGISSSNTARDLAYRTWTPSSGWSSEQYIDDTGHATDIQYYWVSLASNPTSGSNEIALVGIDGTDSDVVAWIWSGSAWGNMNELTASAAIATEEDAAVAYETISGKAIFGYGVSGANIQSKVWTGTAWNNTASTLSIDGSTANWITMKSDPSSNQIMLVSVDGSSDLNTFLWRASPMTWVRGTGTDHDTAVDTNAARCADFNWEPTGSKGLLVWGTTSGYIAYKTFTAPTTWGTQQNPAMGTNTHALVQLRSNPRSVSGDVMILGAIVEDVAGSTNDDIGAIKWDGTAFTVIGSNTISSDLNIPAGFPIWECFEIEFMNFGPPTEFTSEVEFTGTSNTQSWTQLVWTVDSSFTTTSVTTTLQLYNFNSGQYSTSGDGYMTDTIGTTDVTKTQTVTTNPTYYRNSTGGWKIKIKGVKSTATQFDWKGDLVKFEAGYALNLRVRDWDLTDNIQGAYVYVDSDVKTSDVNGWANWTCDSGTVQIKVKYYGFWVNGTFSVTMDSDKTIDVQCKLYDVTIKVQEEQHNAYLVSANVTVFNASSTSGNKIKSGITGSNGQVSFTNLPNNTLVFTQYAGSSYTIVIGNTTQTVSSENQSITLTANQNYVSTSNPYSIIAFLGLIIPLKRHSQPISQKKTKRKNVREGEKENENKLER